MLSDFPVHPSLATSDLGRAQGWYDQKLGLTPEATFDGILVYRRGGGLFTVYRTPSAGTARNTVAGWGTADIRAEVASLRARGVVFEEYDLGDLKTQDAVAELDGQLGAWFKDADGNTFGIGQPLDGRPPNPAVSGVIAAADLGRARAFYAGQLGLEPRDERPGGVVFGSGGSELLVYETPFAGTARNTVAVWRVRDLRGLVDELRGRAVAFEDYDFGDARTVDGILTDSDGTSNAWFKDSEGNVLALAEDLSLPMR